MPQVKNYNVLFIDNPVGTGFSYVERPTAYSKTNKQIADDLVTCMKEFYKQLPKFRNVPTYILTESYGGKMGAEFALVWDRVREDKQIKYKKKKKKKLFKIVRTFRRLKKLAQLKVI